MSKNVPPLPFPVMQIILGPLVFSSNNWRWYTTVPNCFNLWIALEGQAEMKTMGKTYPIQPGTAFVFSPHQEVSAKTISKQPFRNFACRFAPPGATGDALKHKASKLMGIPASDLAHTKKLCHAAVQSTHYKDALALQQFTGLCFQILAQVWRDAHTPVRRDPDAAIIRLMDRIREQPSHRLSAEKMAEEARLSVAQFNRRFLALSGESPVDFTIRQRILHAKHYLHGSSQHISEIANALGYTDIYFFSRQFKQRTGISPSAYRRSLGLDNKPLQTDSSDKNSAPRSDRPAPASETSGSPQRSGLSNSK